MLYFLQKKSVTTLHVNMARVWKTFRTSRTNVTVNIHSLANTVNLVSCVIYDYVATKIFAFYRSFYKLVMIIFINDAVRFIGYLAHCTLITLYRKNCIQSIQCCISRRSETAKIKCYKL